MFRTYDPSSKRYMQSDPMGLAAGWNTYNYVGRNPLNGVDPLGLYVRVLIAEGSYQNIGHVALDINGITYGLMPMVKVNLDNVSESIPGIIDVKTFEDFKEHYLDPNENVARIHAFTLKMTEEDELQLLKDINQDIKYYKFYASKNYNILYQGSASEDNNCASWAMGKVNKYLPIAISRAPWLVKNLLKKLAPLYVLKYQEYEVE